LLLVVFPGEGNEGAEFPFDHLDAVDDELIVQDHSHKSLQGVVRLLVADGVHVDLGDFYSLERHIFSFVSSEDGPGRPHPHFDWAVGFIRFGPAQWKRKGNAKSGWKKPAPKGPLSKWAG